MCPSIINSSEIAKLTLQSELDASRRVIRLFERALTFLRTSETTLLATIFN